MGSHMPLGRQNRSEAARWDQGTPGDGSAQPGPMQEFGEKANHALHSMEDSVGDAAHAVEHSVGSAVQKAGAFARQAQTSIGQKAHDASATIGHFAHDASGSVTQMGHDAAEQGRRAQRRVETYYHDNPLVVGAVVVAVGTLVGLSIPITAQEDRWMGEASDDVTNKARVLAQQGLQQLDHVAKEAADGAPCAAAALRGAGAGVTICVEPRSVRAAR
jgi:ElaB/YqjD/DUF883 family membrane-anchored ribosome-binding protein